MFVFLEKIAPSLSIETIKSQPEELVATSDVFNNHLASNKNMLYMTPYKLHLLQQFKDANKPARENFCTQMQAMLKQDGFDDRLVFRGVATFDLTGKVNKHNTRIWGN